MNKEKYRGALLGLACGDAVGTTVEFKARHSFTPVTDMTGGGPFRLNAGEWTDDTSMALCLAHSLLHCNGFDPEDQMNRYCNWYRVGYMSCTGECFDIGSTVRSALHRYLETKHPFSGCTDAHSAGNGSIMRLAPIPMFYVEDVEATLHYAGESSRTTHGAKEAIECARLFAAQLRTALVGGTKDDIFMHHAYQSTLETVQSLAEASYRHFTVQHVVGSGYVVRSLEAALWCFYHSDSFEEAVLRAANLGDDADTTAAIVGQVAGAYYGVEGIPARWVSQLAMKDEIERLADRLYEERFVLSHA
ncbi:ADP-ribosylglycohydrolase family protein [Ketobacter sp.]|nr:MAG: ADP-ribosylglycohydrolase family protein [Ketobacter sp.]